MAYTTSFLGSLSSATLVIGRTILAVAGHVIIQNLGDKKICWARGLAECFDCCCGKVCGFKILEQSMLKATRFIGVGY